MLMFVCAIFMCHVDVIWMFLLFYWCYLMLF